MNRLSIGTRFGPAVRTIGSMQRPRSPCARWRRTRSRRPLTRVTCPGPSTVTTV